MEITYQPTDHDLTVLKGQIPIRELPALMKRHGHDAIVDTWLARALKATMVIGSPEACARKREALGLSQLPTGEIAAMSLDQQVDAWRRRGDVGASSEALADMLMGVPHAAEQPAHPHDASDFQRCALLLVWAPGLRERLPTIATRSAAWRAIVAHWDALEMLLSLGETGHRRLYDRLSELLS
ncbi:hypothetical protein [Halomonas sp. LBP4]|uniref:hypothetical protein n=1 Tax=Halomonas sp. LBP4 TaxID=2044917 RepID=UPI000D76C3AD|nr:hypothetical protein [Halomonas sp. LBP4]PXX94675.1 hypothetical protein CR157_21460 [Halomonas sp. LBP4]